MDKKQKERALNDAKLAMLSQVTNPELRKQIMMAAAKAKALCARTILSVLPRLTPAVLPRLLLYFHWQPCTITPGHAWTRLDTQVRHGRGKGYCRGTCGGTRSG